MAIEQIMQDLTQSIVALTAAVNALAAAQSSAQPVSVPYSHVTGTMQPSSTVTVAPAQRPFVALAAQAVTNAPVPAPDFATTQRLLAGIAEKLGNPQPVVEIMQRMGAQRLSDIPAEKYGELIAAAQALVN